MPLDNLILAYTLTPQKIIDSMKIYPNLDARIKAVNHALDLGFKVRICLTLYLQMRIMKSSFSMYLKN